MAGIHEESNNCNKFGEDSELGKEDSGATEFDQEKGAANKCQPFLVYSCFAAIIGTSFLFGYEGVVIDAPYLEIHNFINASSIQHFNQPLTQGDLYILWSLFASLWSVGGFVGSIWIPGYVSFHFGRTRSLCFNSIIGTIGGLVMFFSGYPFVGSYVLLMMGQFIVGYQIGVGIIIIPSLITELAPVQQRGFYGTLNELALSVGGLVSACVSFNYLLGEPIIWNYLFLIPSAICFLHGILLIFAAESPRWLVDKGRMEMAMTTLKKLRLNYSDAQVIAEFEEMKQVSEAECSIDYIGLRDFFSKRQLWLPLLICVNLFAMQQFSGMNTVGIYSSQILTEAGFSTEAANIGFIGIQALNLLLTAVSMFIADRVGRRLLLLVGIAGLCVSHIFITLALCLKSHPGLVLSGLMSLTIAYAIGPGPVPWYLAAEMFTQNARPAALSVCGAVNWLADSIAVFLFPLFRLKFPDYSFLPYTGWMIFSFIIFFLFLPDTTGMTSEQISELFAQGQPLLQCQLRRGSREGKYDSRFAKYQSLNSETQVTTPEGSLPTTKDGTN